MSLSSNSVPTRPVAKQGGLSPALRGPLYIRVIPNILIAVPLLLLGAPLVYGGFGMPDLPTFLFVTCLGLTAITMALLILSVGFMEKVNAVQVILGIVMLTFFFVAYCGFEGAIELRFEQVGPLTYLFRSLF